MSYKKSRDSRRDERSRGSRRDDKNQKRNNNTQSEGQKNSRSGSKQAKRTLFRKPEVEGIVHMTREGYAFVMVEDRDNDVFVAASKTRGALNGDDYKNDC